MMSHTVAVTLRDPARTFSASSSQGFSVQFGKRHKDSKTSDTIWTNYEAVFFASSTKQIAYYEKVLVPGSTIQVSSDDIKIEIFKADNGVIYPTVQLVNSRLEIIQVAGPNKSGNGKPADFDQYQGYKKDLPQG
jgi:hypothetical protein